MISKEHIKLAVAAGLVAGCMYSGWSVRGWYEGAKDAAVLAAERKTQDMLAGLALSVAQRTEEAIQGIKIENRTIYQEATKEIIREPIYSDCVLPESGRLRVNAARGAATARKPDNPVRANASPQ